MRIIKLIFFSLLFIFLAGVIAFFIGREIILLTGVSQIKSSFKEVASMARNSGSYALECRKKGITDLSSGSIEALQIRFTSDTQYQIEVICRQFSLDPVVVKEAVLPRFVRKSPGFSGLIWGDELSGVGIEVFGKTKSVFIEEQEIFEGGLVDIQGAIGPVTNCAGLGFECCQAETSLGQGGQIFNVTDCSQSCFTSCVQRPIVVSFSTQPFFDKEAGLVKLNKGAELTAAYVIDPGGSGILNVVLDFGDGTQESFTEFKGQATHTYQCNQVKCGFLVKVTATNEAGISAAQTPVTNIKVIVQ